jgi:hypothetical protein
MVDEEGKVKAVRINRKYEKMYWDETRQTCSDQS